MLTIKILLTTLLVLILPFVGATQTVNGTPISEIEAPYVQIVGASKTFHPFKLTVHIDFGEGLVIKNKEPILKDEKGEILTFVYIIDAVNFMSEQGYFLVNSYGVGNDGKYVHYFIMRKTQYDE